MYQLSSVTRLAGVCVCVWLFCYLHTPTQHDVKVVEMGTIDSMTSFCDWVSKVQFTCIITMGTRCLELGPFLGFNPPAHTDTHLSD